MTKPAASIEQDPSPESDEYYLFAPRLDHDQPPGVEPQWEADLDAEPVAGPYSTWEGAMRALGCLERDEE